MARSARNLLSRKRFRAARRLRLRVEGLEGRSVPAAFPVMNDLDAGPGSLRQAILDSNALAGADEIQFDPGFFAAPHTITLTTGELLVRDDLTVTGPGAGQLTVSGNNASRVFNIDDGAFDPDRAVRLEGLTISGGRAGSGDGGGIRNAEALELVDCTVSGNTADGDGGGIFSRYFTTLTVASSTVSGNTASRDGGGIGTFSYCTLTVASSTVSGNTALRDGGGIFNLEGTVTAASSTVSGNTASQDGGGVAIRDGMLTAASSTVSGNAAVRQGGGIASYEGTVTLANSTVSGNTAGVSGGGLSNRGYYDDYYFPDIYYDLARATLTQVTVAENAAPAGGNIANGKAGSLTLANSVVADAASGGDVTQIPDGVSSLTLSGANLVEDGSVAGSGVINADPKLGSLADNGGRTKTYFLLPGSPAIDAGDIGLLGPVAFDQRGPGFSRLRGAGIDLGAVEAEPTGPVTVAAVTGLAREDDPAANTLVFAIRRTDDPADPLDVPAAFGGTAPPGDYTVTVAGGTQTPTGFQFASGSAELTVSLTVVDDAVPEVAETVVLSIGPAPGFPADAALAVIDRDFDTQVTTTADDGRGSLRLALRNADDRPGADVVSFDPAVFSTPRTITLTSGELAVHSDVAIIGPGPGLLTVSGNNVSRVFVVNDDAVAARAVRIEGLTITGGRADEFGGGGIRNAEALELVDCTVSENTADGDGGGITNFQTLTVTNSTVSGNTAGRDGGGIYNRGGTLTVVNSTVSGNAAMSGGGIANSLGTVDLANSTVSGNTASFQGGGLSNRGRYDYYYGYYYPAQATLTQVTVTGNAAAAGGNIANGELGTLTLANSVVADAVSGGDVFRSGEVGESLTLSGANLVEDGSVAGSGVINADPKLGPLTEYGGPTSTVSPLPGSPAIDAGDGGALPADLTLDQRGLARVFGVAVDIGAVEAQPPRVTINQGVPQPDPTTVPSVAFDVEFTVPVTGFDPADIDLSESTAGGTLAAAVTQVAPTRYTVTVTGMTTRGTVVASIPAGAATDPAGFGSAASTSADNQVLFAEDVPTVTINRPPGQDDPTSVPSVTFAVEFSEPVAGFDAADVSFAGSTVGGPLQAAWTQTGPTMYTVTVTGMTTRGTVVASVPAGVVTDSAGLPNEASTSTDNVVEFLNAGTLAFATAAHATAEGDVLRVFVSRTGGSEGVVSISYATVGGTAQAGSDFAAEAGTLTWAEGETADKSFDVPVVNDAANEGWEAFSVTLSNPVGGAQVGLATTTVAIAPSDGAVVDGTARLPQTVFMDDTGVAGDLVTVRLAGKTGTATVYLTDPDGDGRGPIEWIDLAGTDAAKSALTITVRTPRGGTGDGRITLAGLTGTGLKLLTAPATDLIGTGINLAGYLGTAKLGDISGGADVVVNGSPPAALKNPSVKLTVGDVGDGTAFTVPNATLGALTAIAVGDGTVTAPSVGTITVEGKPQTRTAAAVPGDFESDIAISGAGVDPANPALKRLQVAGGITHAVIRVGGNLGGLSVKGRVDGTVVDVAGNVGAVSVGSFWNSRLAAGYTGPDDGSGAFDTPSSVGPFRVTARADGFRNSYVIASTIKPVTLASITTANSGTKFGFVAQKSLAGLTVAAPAQRFKFDPTQPSPQSQPGWDFVATVLDNVPPGP